MPIPMSDLDLTRAQAPLVLTKLRTPRLPDGLIERPRLTARCARSARLTLITAPAGYGKTTLAAQWVAGQGDCAAACMSLDPTDNEGHTFERYVVAALASVCDPPLHGDDALSLATVINALTRCERQAVLILDDAHVITSPVAQQVLQTLLDRLPECVSLILTSRAQPALALGRLRATGGLVELRADELRFTPVEADALLNGVMQLGLSEREIADLAERTEGWIAGLRLAAAALAQQPPEYRAQAIADFGGGHRFVRDYLREEVFIHQDSATQQFLVRTAQLGFLSPQMCDAALGCTGSDDVLERLARANVFVQAVDESGNRYRYHRLFAQFLAQCAREPDGDTRQPHRHSNANPATDALSERELEVVALMAQGLSNAQIAQRICVAPGTVKRHVHNIFGKLNARTRAEAIVSARSISHHPHINQINR
jgi:LuxR family maltose regulon positive regulatory protein